MTGQFIISRMGPEAGESLECIVARKEVERQAGDGQFWWGIGSRLGKQGFNAGKTHRGQLPVLFAKMLSTPKRADVAPDQVFVWTHWENLEGRGEIPHHVLITSRGDQVKRRHYALACTSDDPIRLGGRDRFDPSRCPTANGKVMGDQQVTALLNGSPYGHPTGKYAIEFEATLAAPYCPELVTARPLDGEERELLKVWRPGQRADWLDLIREIRGRT